ncbi:MAG: malectin domain-containing carbohydrate-binding protein [Candidatus Sulfotelmatobacter sp.]|jgi:malectin (di-glucose binding ER protein)
MTTRGAIPHPDHVDPGRRAKEQASLHAVLASGTFENKLRLANLLKYICEKYFEGDIDAIKEYAIATDVFGRSQSFDQATDSIVRVEVFRLRKTLREFYDGEGADLPMEIVVATGHYRPEFIDRIPRARLQNPSQNPVLISASADPERAVETKPPSWTPDGEKAHREGRIHLKEVPSRVVHTRTFERRGFLAFGAILAIATVGLTMWWFSRDRHANANEPQRALSSSSLVTGPEVRIRCGYSRPIFKDTEGNVWAGDRFFTGGFVTELPNQHIARTRSPELYLTGRTGVFSYNIPLAPGTYELRLHFAETTYSPASSLGGGENSRVFDIQLNGIPLLKQFDIVSDAGANTADVRVFRNISPGKDGYLHLDFTGSLGLPIINAIEIVPGLPYHLRPIRMVAQNSFFVDAAGNLWMPDTYYSSGQLASDKVAIGGTSEPGLYAGERYGNFNYALPVDKGSYKLTLYFSEKYWGSDVSKTSGTGRRVFDVFCNGVALMRNLDIAEAAGFGRALVKTYHGLRPNAQGKLIISFVPDVNYASVDAVEVEEETP